jgi:hypothetical protein
MLSMSNGRSLGDRDLPASYVYRLIKHNITKTRRFSIK